MRVVMVAIEFDYGRMSECFRNACEWTSSSCEEAAGLSDESPSRGVDVCGASLSCRLGGGF